MLKRADIEKFYEEVSAMELKFPVASIARATGESKGNVSKILSRKLDPSESFIKRFREQFSESSKKVSPIDHGSEGVWGQKAIFNLTESNRQIAESNASLARSNEELVQMVKQTTGGAYSKRALDFAESISGILEQLAEIQTGPGKKFRTLQDAHEALNKLSPLWIGAEREKGKIASGDKKSRA